MSEKDLENLSPIDYLSEDNYPRLFEELQKYLRNNAVDVPSMGDNNPDRIQKFKSLLRDFLYEQLHIKASRKSVEDMLLNRVEEVVVDLFNLIRGFGPLTKFINLKGVEEVIVRRGCILLEIEGQVRVVENNLANEKRAKLLDEQFSLLARRIADLGKTPVTEMKPYAVSEIPETRDRFGVIIPPLSLDYTSINIRVFPKDKAYTMRDLSERGMFKPSNEEEADTAKNLYQDGRQTDFFKLLDRVEDSEARKELELLRKQVGGDVASFLGLMAYHNLANVLIAGEFSSGKTTLLNAMSYFIRENTITSVVEDFYELKIQQPYAMRLITYRIFDPGEIINVVLTRMRPDLIIVGELVDKRQTFEFLNASNFGKKSWSTIHANNARGSLIRVENLATIEGYTPYEIRRRVVNSIDVVVHVARNGRERFVNEIALVEKNLDASGDYVLASLHSSRRLGERASAVKMLWQGIREQD